MESIPAGNESVWQLISFIEFERVEWPEAFDVYLATLHTTGLFFLVALIRLLLLFVVDLRAPSSFIREQLTPAGFLWLLIIHRVFVKCW